MSNRANRIEKETPVENTSQTVDVYIGVFFEGTGNHRGQAELGEAKRTGKEYKGIALPITSSNSVSNVAMLEYLYDKFSKKYVDTVYIEGVGVSSIGVIDPEGLAIGTGDNGIEMKVNKAIRNVGNRITEKEGIDANSRINLHIDVFGFSRGAAAARFLVSQISGSQRIVIALKLLLKKIYLHAVTIEFVGLYDTVSSHGYSFGNDVKTLDLNAIKKSKKVFQICATDEFRKKFALTNIKSAGKNGTEIFLPGCHTDIGGGYLDGEDSTEKVNLNGLEWGEREPVDLLEMGYDLCSFMRFGWIGGENKYTQETEHSLFSSKKTYNLKFNSYAKKGYSAITYELMKESACELREKMFKDIVETTIPEELNFVKDNAFDCTSVRKSREIFYEDYPKLTKDWLHFSSKGGLINNPRVVNNFFEREVHDG
jgi:hypothetical protein